MSNNGNNKFTIDCPHCKQHFTVPSPKLERINTGRVSIVVVTHEKPIRCICGGAVVLAIEAAQLAWIAMPISDQQAAQLEGSKIIKPPEGIRLIG